MKELIKKDLRMNKGFIIIASIFPYQAFQILSETGWDAYLLFSYNITLIVGILTMLSMDEQKTINTKTLFLSLPINRNDLIKSKYLVYGALSLIWSIVLYFTTVIVKILPRFEYVTIGLDVIIFSTSIALIFLAIILPILCRLDSGYFLSMIGFIFLGFLLHLKIRVLIIGIGTNINYEFIHIILPIVAIIAYILSYKMSKVSFDKR